MADNTGEEHFDDPSNSPLEEAADGAVPTANTEAINPIQETDNMEVHKHAHHVTHKKKWGEYLLEFLMLFLAVTLGFIAENLREEMKHKEEVRIHINSLVTDLHTDVALFDSVADRNTYSSEMADSLIELLHSDITNTPTIYFAARAVTANNGYGYSNSKSFDQMKSSGLLTYIRAKTLLDSIGTYYASFQWLDNQTELMRLKLNEIHKNNVAVFDSYVFQQMMKVRLTSFGGGRTLISMPVGKPALLSADVKEINAVSLSYHYYSTTTKFYKRSLLDLKDRANRLIEMIKKEYPSE